MKRIAMSLNGGLIDIEPFIKDLGIKYFGQKYGLAVVDPQGSDVDAVFGLTSYFKQNNPHLSEDAITAKVKKVSLEFWKKHGINYYSKVPFRDGVVETFQKLLTEGYEIYISIDRMPLNDNNILSCVKKLFNKNGLDHNQMKFIFVDDNNSLKDITYRNYFDIVVSDTSKDILENQEITDVIAINTAYNEVTELSDVIRVDGFANDELYNVIKQIERKNNQPLLDPSTPITDYPSNDKRWLQYYTTGDLKWTLYRHSPYDRMQMATRDFPNDSFLYYGLLKDLVPNIKMKRKMTNKEFNKKVDECANALMELGIQKGEAVPFQFANSPEAKVVIYALYKIKAKIVPIFGLAEKDEIINKISGLNPKPRIYFATDICYSKIKDAMEELDIPKVVTLSLGTSAPIIEKMFWPLLGAMVRKKAKTAKVPYGGRFIKYTDFVKSGKDGNYEFPEGFDDSYIAAQLFTGGTIKFKGVEITEDNIDAGVQNFLNKHYNFTRNKIMGDFMPLDHTFGLFIANHISSSVGMTLDVIMKFNIKVVAQVLRRVNVFGGVPTLFPAINKDPEVKKSRLQNVEYFLSGGSPLKDSIKDETNETLEKCESPARVIDGFGLTETTGGVLYNGIPVIGHDMKIVDPETGLEKGYGPENIGVLCVTGRLIFKKYANDPTTTEKALNTDGWFYTGDMGYINTDGKFHFASREDDMIIVNGSNVYPKQIEDIVDTVPGIKKSSIIGKKDKKGQVVVTLIELEENHDFTEALENELREIYARLPYYARPIETIVVDKLVDTRIFKPDKKAHRLILEKNETITKYIKVGEE